MTAAVHTPAGRTWIITPATGDASRFTTAQTCGADVALVDLEDSVAPDHKPAARTRAQTFFAQPPGACTLGIRINALITRDGVQDLLAITQYPSRPAVVLVPMVESARDVEVTAAVLDTTGYTPQIYALIETPRAIDKLPSIVRAQRLAGLFFGSADNARLLGCTLDWETLLYARSRLVSCAADAALPAVDAPYFDLNDLDGLKQEAEKDRALGFHGKGIVHPRQLPVVAAAFHPTEEEITHARAVVAASRQSGTGIVAVGGHMVGAPLLARAHAVLAQAGES
ncbi:HpcH/HpaI aldolase/citrate lyase family protein [Streptomyces phaeochromogenes]|uniref:HpcH/HpaI aldolase/citrate lyase family protein n=1 Tax=Streptomyces phaeochromogenes TaxID=1923 RepID=UPI0033D4D151